MIELLPKERLVSDQEHITGPSSSAHTWSMVKNNPACPRAVEPPGERGRRQAAGPVRGIPAR
jgi:hypothetical protein